MTIQFRRWGRLNACPAALVAVFAAATLVSTALAQSGPPRGFQSHRLRNRVTMYYQALWGVDTLSAKLAESGELVRFSYRVVNPDKAAPLNDKKSEPTLFDPQAGVSLVIPTVQNVGLLRQTSTPVAGKSYWMTFSNKGRPVKRGDHVTVVIGRFRAEGLIVE